MLELLSQYEERIIKECLTAIVDWWHYNPANLPSLLGFSQKQMREIAEQWPNDKSLDTQHAVINTLRYWLFCPVVDSNALWKPSIASRWELRKIFIKLQDKQKPALTVHNTVGLIDFLEKSPEVNFLFFDDRYKKSEKINRGCLSQNYHCDVASGFRLKSDPTWYRTAQQYMMAEKARLFGDGEADENVLQEKLFDIIVTGNEAKFSIKTELKHFLTSTDNKIIAYANPDDCLLGIGLPENHPDVSNPKKWRGSNILGFALMKVRDRLYEIETKSMIMAALLKAVPNNDIVLAKELLETGINVVESACSEYGLGDPETLEKMFSLLHYAASKDYREMASLLITLGMSVDQGDLAGCTALHYAVWNGHKEMALLLIKAGADVNARGDVCCCMEQYMPLQVASSWNKGNPDMVTLLLEHGAIQHDPLD